MPFFIVNDSDVPGKTSLKNADNGQGHLCPGQGKNQGKSGNFLKIFSGNPAI